MIPVLFRRPDRNSWLASLALAKSPSLPTPTFAMSCRWSRASTTAGSLSKSRMAPSDIPAASAGSFCSSHEDMFAKYSAKSPVLIALFKSPLLGSHALAFPARNRIMMRTVCNCVIFFNFISNSPFISAQQRSGSRRPSEQLIGHLLSRDPGERVCRAT